MQTSTPRAPIHRLPLEILSHVFRDHIDLDTRDRGDLADDSGLEAESTTARSVTLTHVCRTWRSSAIGDPALWTTVYIASPSELWTLFLDRSSLLPIDVVINLKHRFFHSKDAEDDVQRIVEMLRVRFDTSLANKERPTTPNRIRSLSITTGVVAHAITLNSFFEGYNLLALSTLYLRPVESECMSSYEPLYPLCRPSLTRLSLHHWYLTIDADRLRDIFTSCTGLETLVLGVLGLSNGYRLLHDPTLHRTDKPKIHVPALRTLVAASPIFIGSSGRSPVPCREACICAFRDLVADNLQYLEIAGVVCEALTHLTPLVARRAKVPNTPPLTLRISTDHGLEDGFENLERRILALPPNINLHIYSDKFCSQEVISEPFDEWIGKANTTTFYLTDSEENREELECSGDHPLTSYPRLDPIRGLIPVIIHPTIGSPFLPEEGGTAEIPRWYHDPETITKTIFPIWQPPIPEGFPWSANSGYGLSPFL